MEEREDRLEREERDEEIRRMSEDSGDADSNHRYGGGDIHDIEEMSLFDDGDSPSSSLARSSSASTESDYRSVSSAADFVPTYSRSNLQRLESVKEKRNREVEVFNIQTMASVAEKLGVSLRALGNKLRELDLSTEKGSHSVLKEDVARLVIEEFGFTPVKGAVEIQPQVVASLRRKALKTEEYLALPPRPPVITVMGHVDHGKTTLLDRLRRENRAAGEAGGITQAIGAFRVDLTTSEVAEAEIEGEEEEGGKKKKKGSSRREREAQAAAMGEVDEEGKPTYATFLDTPGHAAFKSMRAKGCSAGCTDLVILVISAVDGLQPQSLEVIQLARQNNVPLIIAVNKCDISGADPQQILRQLQVHDVVVESMGGEILSCNISAKTGQGIDELKDLIRLTGEVLQLHADRTSPGEAYVLESRISKKGGGCVAQILVKNGQVKTGDFFVCGLQYGRIRTMHDENERVITGPLFPGQAAALSGFKSLDDVTEDLYVVPSEEMALKIIEERRELVGIDESDLVGSEQNKNQRDQKAQAYKIQVTRRKKRVAIRPLTEEEKSSKALVDNSVPVIVKADVSGSMEVLLDYFSKLPREEVIASIVRSGLGEINVADVEYAAEIGSAAGGMGATIVGFNVKPSSEAILLAKQKGITIFHHPVIYSLWDDIRALLSERLPAEMEEVEVGQASVQQLFPLSGGGGKKKNKADAEAAAAAAAAAADGSTAVAAAEGPAMVAGCRVKSGKMDSKLRFKILRDEETIFEGSQSNGERERKRRERG